MKLTEIIPQILNKVPGINTNTVRPPAYNDGKQQWDPNKGSTYSAVAEVFTRKQYSGQDVINAFYADAENYLKSNNIPVRSKQDIANVAFTMMKDNGFSSALNNPKQVYDNSENYWANQKQNYQKSVPDQQYWQQKQAEYMQQRENNPLTDYTDTGVMRIDREAQQRYGDLRNKITVGQRNPVSEVDTSQSMISRKRWNP